MRKELKIDSPPAKKLQAVKKVAEKFNSDLTSVVCRDIDGYLTSVSVHARGKSAAALERWLKRQDVERKP
jgi:hypothetical protein